MKRTQKVQALAQKKEKFVRNGFPPLLPKNENQSLLLEALKYDSIVVAQGSAGTGKAQPLYSRILTPTGWKQMGEIKVGDKVRSVDSWTTVTGVYPQGKKDCVRFWFNDGSFVDSSTDHLWTVFCNKRPGEKRSTSKSKVQTLKSSEIIDRLANWSKTGNISVQSISAIEYPEKQYTLSPYVLGVLIGDGSLTQHGVCFTSVDPEIIERVREELPVGCKINTPINGGISYYISDSLSTWEVKNRCKSETVRLGLHGKYSYEKTIPEEYKNGSIEQRYNLLQGLMDTDGTVCKNNGSASFCTTSKQLAEDIREVVLSLGGKASVVQAEKYFTYLGEKKKGRLAYIVSINVLDKSRLFSLTRKKLIVSNTDSKQLRRVIKRYEFIGEQECQCISVADPSHLYVTDGYVLTHNTMVSCWHAAKKLFYGDIKKIVLIRAYQPLAGRTIGFMPGTAEEKLKPFYQQMLDYLEDFLGKGAVETNLKSGNIEMTSLETIRGRSWDNAIIIVDEGQNLFVPEVQALVTRIGENSQMVFCGDNSGLQTDVKNTMDGLTYLSKIVEKYKIPEISIIQFTRNDICRSDITKSFVIAFEDELIAEQSGKSIIPQAEVNKQFKKGR